MLFGGRATGSPNLSPLSGLRARGRRLLGEIGKRLEIAVGLRQHVGQIDREPGVNGLQVDHIVALDHAQAQTLVCLQNLGFSWC